MTKTMIEFKNVTFRYNAQAEPTLKHINLQIDEGEKVLVVGPSGSGKSTLGNLINGVIPENFRGDLSGEIYIDGKNTKDMSIFDTSLKVGTLLQNSNDQFVGLTVAEDIAFGMENDCFDNQTMQTKVNQWSKKLSINNLLKQAPNSLSGGQKQRTGLAGLLVDDAPILLLDEPLAALDPMAGSESIQLLQELHNELKNTIIIIEHRLEESLTKDVDKIILMNDGEIVGIYNPAELLKQNILNQYGIREPLYIEALKSIGIDLNKLHDIDSVEAVDGPGVADRIEQVSAKAKSISKYNASADILSIKKLNFAYDKKVIFNNLNVDIQKGDMISLVGKNGVGKTTLSKLIVGFLQPDAGEITFNGDNLLNKSIKERADDIGYIMQDPDKMISKVMIYDEVALGLKLRHYPKEQIKEKVDHALKVCNLYPFRHWPISALSYGQKKRLTIASMLVLSPKLLILDEPTAGQDYYHYTEIMNFLSQLNQEQGLTMIFITHDMHLMAEYSTRTLVIGDQTILRDNTPEKVLDDEALLAKANLKRTSLSILAKRFNVNYNDFSNYLISKERDNQHE
ncbi:ABC transporter ATP-binding protein [Apilactobacillus micheneri]|uniref:ABC transporter ATP-binding protein n=1 Tax=Apilactobacillus micheneri TaxID=1899430 RepID=UPI000D521490|nr:ABC transporter ATP-binding protein [Apilactobacillus micheneri]TPR43915.1 ATP-binding cassette domain-containing protein [Apilactobacillus micheneri]TPR47687.1 ATP-binding cassette domain-containing protein [Apilactobacillus micheneri]TPR50955.1 ATP-binding cassette domain-containing protein [Apilactobacillus micheneri]GAY79834.1 putative HMP/thiamine import ATP-binding protein YkoD [Apilactobacillus micheneri]